MDAREAVEAAVLICRRAPHGHSGDSALRQRLCERADLAVPGTREGAPSGWDQKACPEDVAKPVGLAAGGRRQLGPCVNRQNGCVLGHDHLSLRAALLAARRPAAVNRTNSSASIAGSKLTSGATRRRADWSTRSQPAAR